MVSIIFTLVKVLLVLYVYQLRVGNFAILLKSSLLCSCWRTLILLEFICISPACCHQEKSMYCHHADGLFVYVTLPSAAVYMTEHVNVAWSISFVLCLQVVAAEAWAQYKQRNDSVVVDLFQGQYKSKLVCPKCEKVKLLHLDVLIACLISDRLELKYWFFVYYKTNIFATYLQGVK